MARLTVDTQKCKACYLCLAVCPRACLIIEKKLNKRGVQPVTVKPDAQCVGCRMCALMCPECCIEITRE